MPFSPGRFEACSKSGFKELHAARTTVVCIDFSKMQIASHVTSLHCPRVRGWVICLGKRYRDTHFDGVFFLESLRCGCTFHGVVSKECSWDLRCLMVHEVNFRAVNNYTNPGVLYLCSVP